MCIRSCVDRFFRKLLAVAASGLIAVVAGAGATHAMPAYIPVVQNYSSASFAGGQTAGSILTATTAQTFNSLGFIDVNPSCLQCGPDGLLGSYQVGIWLVSSQALLASAWVTPSSPLGTIVDGGYSFRWASIPTVTISAGEQFIMGALLPASPLDAFLVNPTYVNKVGITDPGRGRFEIGGTLSYPSQIVSPFATWAVANASDMIVPEPTTAVLLSLGVCGVAMVRRQRRTDA